MNTDITDDRALLMFMSFEAALRTRDRAIMLNLLMDILSDSDAYRATAGLPLRPVTLHAAGYASVGNQNDGNPEAT